MKENIEILYETMTSNALTIQHQDDWINNLISGWYPPFGKHSPNYTMDYYEGK